MAHLLCIFWLYLDSIAAPRYTEFPRIKLTCSTSALKL